jgi:8-oxo-dGTP pyrophosphatase MutT (NUDIX family)
VLLVRDGVDGVELFLMRRQQAMAFAGGMTVFPGGGVDPRDGDASLPWAGPAPERWGQWLGASPVEARELVCAAVRETFEECGVLLAGPSADELVDDVSSREWESDRLALISRDVALSDLLQRRGLVLRSDLLRPWAHWVTPEFEPRRYDTRFFLAAVPPGQKARHVLDGEASESGWWPAAAVLDEFAAGRVVMLPPTLVAVEEVAASASVAALLDAPRKLASVTPALSWDGRVARLTADLP